MAITNFGELKDEIESYLHRSDLTARIENWIQLVEADVNRILGADFSLHDGSDAATNWLLESAPDVYLFGALLHAATWSDDDERIAKYAPLYQRALDTAHDLDFADGGGRAEVLATEFPVSLRTNITTG